MKIAIPVCGERVSTVFDAADELLTIEIRSGVAPEPSRTAWRDDSLIDRTAMIRESGVKLLICGALSKAAERMLEAAGIQVISFIRGTVDEVFEAYCSGHLKESHYFLPGCAPCEGQGRQRRRRGGCKNGGYEKR